jgi:hypothetical protein
MINIFKKICPLFSLIEGYARLCQLSAAEIGARMWKIVSVEQTFSSQTRIDGHGFGSD